MRKNFLIFFISFFAVVPLFAQEKECEIVSGSYIFSESPEQGVKEAKQLALARGIIKILGRKVPLQFLKTRYRVIKKEFIEKAGNYAISIEEKSKKIRGHRAYVTLCVKWDENLLTRKLEELAIVPRGILPPPVKFSCNFTGFPLKISEDSISTFGKEVLKEYGFPVTNENFRYSIEVTWESIARNFYPLFITPEILKLSLNVSSKNVDKTFSWQYVYPFLTTEAIFRDVKSYLVTALEFIRLDWFKNLKTLLKESILIPYRFKNKAVRIFTIMVKNSSTASLVRIGKITHEGIWIVVYHTSSFSRGDVVQDLNNIMSTLGFQLVDEGNYLEVTEKK